MTDSMAASPAPRYALPLLAVMGSASLCLTLASYQFANKNDAVFLAMIIVLALLAIFAGQVARAAPDTWPTLAVVLAFALAPRLYLLFGPPLFSVDVYRYVWEGRADLAGFNPYLHVPSAPDLAFLRDDVIYPWVDKKDYAVSIYPPIAHLLFVLHALTGGGVIAMKAIMLGFEALGAAALISMLATLKLPRALAVVYLWHPAPMWEIANNGHLDGAMTGLLLAGLAWGAARERTYLAGGLIALASLVKPFAALSLPTLWRPFDLKLPAFVIGIAALCYAPFLSAGAGMLGFFSGYARENGLDTGSAFYFLKLFYGANAPPGWATGAYYAVACAIVAGLILRACSRDERRLDTTLRDTAAILITVLFFLSSNLPWYLLPLASLAPLTGSWACFVMPTAGFLLYPIADDAWGGISNVGVAAYNFLALGAIAVDAARWWKLECRGADR